MILNLKERKELKEVFDKIEKMEEKLKNNTEYFDTFNFKVYDLFYDREENFEKIKKLTKNINLDNELDFYLSMMWENFEEDFGYMKNNENRFSWIDYENYCGSSYTLKDTYKQLEYNLNENEFYINDTYELNEFLEVCCYGESSYYNEIEFLATMEELRKQNKKTILKRALTYLKNNGGFGDIYKDIETINNTINQTIRCYKYIEYMKKLVNSEDFLTFTLLNTSINNFNFENLNGMELPADVLDSEIFDNCIIKKAGKNIKLYYSFSKNPVLFRIK